MSVRACVRLCVCAAYREHVCGYACPYELVYDQVYGQMSAVPERADMYLYKCVELRVVKSVYVASRAHVCMCVCTKSCVRILEHISI